MRNLRHGCCIYVVNLKNVQPRTVIHLEDQITLDVQVVISGPGTPRVVSDVGWISEALQVEYVSPGAHSAYFILLIFHHNMPSWWVYTDFWYPILPTWTGALLNSLTPIVETLTDGYIRTSPLP